MSVPEIQVALYDRDLVNPTFVEDLTERVEGLRFGTSLHGGFKSCSFRLKADIFEQWEWITNRLNYRLVLTEKSETVWEGRVEEPKLHFLSNRLDVTSYGYWASLTDQPHHTAYNDVIRRCAVERKTVHLVPMREAFLGHGVHCTQFWREHYRSDDPHYWYATNLEDPNIRGYDALRRVFLLEIAKILGKKTPQE